VREETLSVWNREKKKRKQEKEKENNEVPVVTAGRTKGCFDLEDMGCICKRHLKRYASSKENKKERNKKRGKRKATVLKLFLTFLSLAEFGSFEEFFFLGLPESWI
jgi:hypothetical protein